jgi:hypothetical protein
VVAVLGDGPGRNQDDDAEDVGGNRIAVVPVIPIRDFVAHIGSEKEDDECRNDESNALDNISCIKWIVYIERGELQLSLIGSNGNDCDRGGYDHGDCDHVLHDYGHDDALHVILFFTRDHVNNFYVHVFILL